MSTEEGNSNIQVEITDASEFHCFRIVLNPRSAPGERIELMFHARSLVDLIHKCSVALCEWQAQTSAELLRRMGFPELEAPGNDPEERRMNDTPAELLGKSSEELRFWRLIEERIPESEEAESIVLACGHRICCAIPFPADREYAFCSQCLDAWMEAEKKARTR